MSEDIDDKVRLIKAYEILKPLDNYLTEEQLETLMQHLKLELVSEEGYRLGAGTPASQIGEAIQHALLPYFADVRDWVSEFGMNYRDSTRVEEIVRNSISSAYLTRMVDGFNDISLKSVERGSYE